MQQDSYLRGGLVTSPGFKPVPFDHSGIHEVLATGFEPAVGITPTGS